MRICTSLHILESLVHPVKQSASLMSSLVTVDVAGE